MSASLRTAQYEKARRVLLELLRLKGKSLSFSDLLLLTYDTVYATDRLPMAGNYRLTGYESLDLDGWNTEIGLMGADMEALYAYFNALQRDIAVAGFCVETWKERAYNAATSLLRDAAKYTASSFIKGITEEINPSEYVNPNETTLLVSERGVIELKSHPVAVRDYQHTYDDVSIQRIGAEAFATITGDPLTVVNRGREGGLTLSLQGRESSSCGFLVSVRTEFDGVNSMVLKLGEEDVGLLLTVEVSANRRDYVTAFSAVINHNYVTVPLPITSVRSYRISLLRDAPTSTMLTGIRYDFKLLKVSLLWEARVQSGQYVSLPISLEEGVTSVSLVSEDVTQGATIEYYLSTEVAEDGTASGFVKAKRNDESILLGLNVPTVTHSLRTQSVTGIWPLSPIHKYGGRLFNLFDGYPATQLGDCSISSERFSLAISGEIIQDSVKLYRGINDYAIKSSAIEHRRHAGPLSHPPILNSVTGWTDRIPLRVRVKEVVGPVVYSSGSYTLNQFYTSYAIAGGEQIVLEREDGTEIDAYVLTIDGSDKRITLASASLSEILSPRYRYYVTYTTTLSEYQKGVGSSISLRKESFIITIEGERLVHGVDYEVYPATLSLELSKAGAYRKFFDTISYDDGGDPIPPYPEISVSYDYDETELTSSEFYESYVFVSVPTTITVLPFTGREIEAGNFHRVNDGDYSTSTECVLAEGWNLIQTTQPHPTLMNDQSDVNVLTGLPSSAGIVTKGMVEKQRAFSDSLRRVPPMTLAAMNPTDGRGCFSYSDGKVLLNYIPDAVRQDLLTLAPSLKGAELLVKEPVYDTLLENTAYVAHPEEFELELSYAVSDTPRSVVIRIDINSEATDGCPMVYRLGLNTFKGV